MVNMADKEPRYESLVFISHLVGWIYFVCWSVSFYPQIWLNYKRASCLGLSFDFLLFNFWGFVCYAVYNSAFYFSTSIQEEYRKRNGDTENLVEWNDVLFTYHVLILSVVIIGQAIYYKAHLHQKTSKPALIACLTTVLIAVIAVVLALAQRVAWLDVLYMLSFVKLVATLFKCAPQLYMNYRLKSTAAWSIGNVWLDFTGSILSMLQLFLTAFNTYNWPGIWGNPIKLGLGLFSLVLDVIFLLQHYVFYPTNPSYEELTNLMDDNVPGTLSRTDTLDISFESEGFEAGKPLAKLEK